MRYRLDRADGFTLLELMIVVMVISILASITIPNLLTALDRGKQKRTMTELRAIATALQAYAVDHGNYPDSTGTTEPLIDELTPTYIHTVATEDAWGNAMLYARLDPAADAAEYILWSLGKDGLDDGNDGEGGETHSVNADIVIFDGQFAQWPAGLQN